MNKIEKIMFSLPVMDKSTYINPIKIDCTNENFSLFHPDPYVIKYNGEYYCYSTGIHGIPVLHSKELVQWEHKGYALSVEGEKEYWAPAVIYYNGVFYMYYSSLIEEIDDIHSERMKVATSINPLGPFQYRKTLFNKFSIDAHVVRNEKSEFYLFYSTNDYLGISDKRPGTVILMDRMIDLMTPEGNPRLVVRPTIDQEIFEKNRFNDGRDWHTIEGAFYFKRRDTAYVMYSGNTYKNENYFIGYSTTKDNLCWEKYPNDNTYDPILQRNKFVEGTGHNSVIKAPNNVDDWIVYHGRQVSEKSYNNDEQRQLRMDPLLWIGNKIWIPGPSYTEQDAPALPTLRDLFYAGLSDNWLCLSGEWEVEDGYLVQRTSKDIAALVSKQDFTNYLYEINLKWEPHHIGGLYGVYACYMNENNNIQVMYDVGKRQLIMQPVINGIKGTQVIVDLENDFDFSCYHHIVISKTGSLFKVYIDGLLKTKTIANLSEGKVGILSYYTQACFDGISVTECLELDEDTQNEFIKFFMVDNPGKKTYSQCWEVKDGNLIYNDIQSDDLNEVFYIGNILENYQISIDVKSSRCNGKYAYGIYPSYKDEDTYIKLLFTKKDMEVNIEIMNNGLKEVVKQKLPDNYKFEDINTLIVKKINNRILVLLNNYQIFYRNTNIEHGTFGLIASGSVNFKGISITKR